MFDGTPGPWAWTKIANRKIAIVTAFNEESVVAECHIKDAHRIAAAPDMEAALEVVLADCAMPTATHLNMVQHALAKARGEMP